VFFDQLERSVSSRKNVNRFVSIYFKMFLWNRQYFNFKSVKSFPLKFFSRWDERHIVKIFRFSLQLISGWTLSIFLESRSEAFKKIGNITFRTLKCSTRYVSLRIICYNVPCNQLETLCTWAVNATIWNKDWGIYYV